MDSKVTRSNAESKSSETDAKHEEESERRAPERRQRVRRKPRVNTLEVMETVVEKLKLLDYENEFCAKKSRSPFQRTLFAIEPVAPENASTLLALFLKLVAWLMERCGREFALDKYDDPTTSVNKVMVDLKQMGFAMDFPAVKLRQGFGDATCVVLNYLCDRALEKKNVVLKGRAPIYPDEIEEEAKVDEDADIGMVEDDDIAESSEEEIMYSEMVRQQQRDSGATKEKSPAKKLIETNTDTVKWTAELERVSAKLTKLSRFVISDAEWRTHLATSSSNSSVVRSVYPKAEVALKSIRESMQATIERVVSKENFINSKFDNMQYQFRELQQKLQETQKRYQTTQESVQDLSETLSTISSRLEELKELQDSKGSSMTDTAPLVRMKKALKKLREEMKQMEIRIGVLSHTLMQANMAESANGNGFRAAGDDDELGLESKRPGDRGHTYTDDDTDNDLSDDDDSD